MTTMNVFECRSSFYGFERNVIAQLENLPTDSFYLRRNGSVVELEQIAANDLFQVQFRLVGGKGGFGYVFVCNQLFVNIHCCFQIAAQIVQDPQFAESAYVPRFERTTACKR